MPTVKELKEIAKVRGIKGYSKMKKSQLETVLGFMEFANNEGSSSRPDSACPSGKIVNPSTGRCVSKKGSIGKKLMASRTPEWDEPLDVDTQPIAVSPPRPKPKKRKKKPIPPPRTTSKPKASSSKPATWKRKLPSFI